MEGTDGAVNADCRVAILDWGADDDDDYSDEAELGVDGVGVQQDRVVSLLGSWTTLDGGHVDCTMVEVGEGHFGCMHDGEMDWRNEKENESEDTGSLLVFLKSGTVGYLSYSTFRSLMHSESLNLQLSHEKSHGDFQIWRVPDWEVNAASPILDVDGCADGEFDSFDRLLGERLNTCDRRSRIRQDLVHDLGACSLLS
ncbi:hypothetical protein BJ508DRAFT_314494 [Ascobolus immersus RN42]|uniref:Uncharacterized protein n=1 Tax=Ascobolus immersus RN42 TaxID=1160509 RepID=A0A3N4HET4_ASCIM|nr:hypothetical protein BJ508DRAFT_314494 [Ascobolus immersus RN42]